MDSDKIVNSGRISCGNKWRPDGAKTHRSLEVSLCRRKSITWMITSTLADQPKTGAALRCSPPAGSSPLDPIRRWNLSAKLIRFNSHPQITFHYGLEECLGLQRWWRWWWWGISRYSLLSARMAKEQWAVHANSVQICRQRRRFDSWKLERNAGKLGEEDVSIVDVICTLFGSLKIILGRQSGNEPSLDFCCFNLLLLFPIVLPQKPLDWFFQLNVSVI